MKKYKYKKESKPVICLLIRDLTAGGAQKQSVLLANSLANDYLVTLMVQHKISLNSSLYEIINHSKVNLVFLKGNFLTRLMLCIRYLKVNDVNIVFTYLTSDNMLASVARLFNVKAFIIGGIRNCRIPSGKFFLLLILHWFFHKRTIFNNYSGYNKFVQKGFNIKKCHVIHNTIGKINQKIIRPEKKPIKIISVGRFVHQKDYPTALKAIKLLEEQINPTSIEFRFIIIGYGKLESRIRKLIRQYKLENKVQLVIQPDNLNDYYINSDIYLCTSIFEGLSNTIMEAMNYSLPVVATHVGDNKELVIHKKTGFLSLPKQPSYIAHYLNMLLKDSDMRLRFGSAGNNLLIKNFSNELFLARYDAFIQDLMH
jgi:glycosyltransferase involved in cell wall biosynthesis